MTLPKFMLANKFNVAHLEDFLINLALSRYNHAIS